MKKLILILMVVLFVFTTNAEAKSHKCFWVWSTDVTTGDDNAAPDFVYCDLQGNNKYVSMGASYIQETGGAKSVVIQYDSLYGDGVNTVGGLHGSITNATVMASADATNWDINVISCVLGTCDTGTEAYHQWNDLTTNLKDSIELTPLSGGFKMTVDGDVEDAAPVNRTIVVW